MKKENMWRVCRVVGIIITALFVLLSFANLFAAGLQVGREGAVLALLLGISYVYIIYGFAKNYRSPMAFWIAWFPILYVPAEWYVISLAEVPLGSPSFLLLMALPGVWYLAGWKWGADMPSVRVCVPGVAVAVVVMVVPAFFLWNSFIEIDTGNGSGVSYPAVPQSEYYNFEPNGQGTPFELVYLNESYRCDEFSEQYQEVVEVGGYCLRETHNPARDADMVSYRLTAPREGLGENYVLSLETQIFFHDCAQYGQDAQIACENEQAAWRSPLVVETFKNWFETHADQAVAAFNR